MNKFIFFFLFFSTVVYGQQSYLYRTDRKLIADTTYQIDEDSYNKVKTLERMLLPVMFNKLTYPETARENGIEGLIIVQVFVFKKDFKYNVVRSDNDYLKLAVVEYFDQIDKSIIDKIRPKEGYLNMFIPIEFKIHKDQFYENLKKYGLLTIETKEDAKATYKVR